MKSEELVEKLNERIKELTCLYEISHILTGVHDSLASILEKVVKILPNAWRYPESAVAEINLGADIFVSGALPSRPVSQKAEIEVEGVKRGYLAIHYSSERYTRKVFLKEEKMLLRKLAQEITNIVEKYEQKQREELIQRKMQHSDRLAILGEVTAGIAHELNTPLANILGFAQLIQERAKDRQLLSDIEKIINSSIYSREVLKKLMFFSSEMPQRREMVAINALVDDVIKLLKPTLVKAGIAIEFKPDPHQVSMLLDTVQITQVLFNLLINAIHASSRGGKIKVVVTSDNHSLVLTIIDQGHGISEDIKDRIYEPFFSTKPVGKGAGLGLSVVHGIIKNHGGKINFQSVVSKGTTFVVTLPIIKG